MQSRDHTFLERRTAHLTAARHGALIGAVVMAASLGIWHQVLAPGLPLAEDHRFLAFGLFTAGLFTFAFLVGSRHRR